MRILYYSPHPHLVLNSPSGYGTHMREMIKAFEQSGHEVVPFIVGGEGAPVGSGVREAVRPSPLKRLVPRTVWETVKDARLMRFDRQLEPRLLAEIERVRPDVIYERANFMQVSGVRAARRAGVRHVLEVNSPYLVEEPVRRQYRVLLSPQARAAEREQLLKTDVAAVVSAGLIPYFCERHPVRPDRFLCTPNGIDPQTIRVDERRAEALRAELNPEGRFVAGFVGSITLYQRVDLLIEATARLKTEGLDLLLLLVGESAQVPDMRRRAERLGVADQILFVGRVPHHEVFNYIALMDTAVLPDNLWYGSPTKIFEYGAMGKAVIAPENQTMHDLIRDGEEGLLVRPEAGALAAALKTMITKPARRMGMAEAFRQKVHGQYTWARNVERIVDRLERPVQYQANQVGVH